MVEIHKIRSAAPESSSPEIIGARLYARVSQASDGRSTTEQLELARELAEENGWPVLGEYVDDGISASLYGRQPRKEYRRLIGDLKSGEVLITFDANRGNRRLDDYVELRRLCIEHGCFFAYRDRVYDMRNGRDVKDSASDAVQSEGYSIDLSVAIRRAVRARAKSGKPTGGKPLFGFRRVYSEKEKRHVREIDPNEAALVREMFERYAAGESSRGIAKDWKERGIVGHGGAPLAGSTIRRLLTNPNYAGYTVHQGVPVSYNGQVIVNEELFDQVGRMIKSRPRRQTPDKARYVLSGIPECGREACNGRLGAQWLSGSARRPKNKYVYRCCKCYRVSRDGEFLESLVLDQMYRLLRSPYLIRKVHEASRDNTGLLAEKLQQMKKLEERRDEFVRFAADPSSDITPAGLAEFSREINDRIAAARREAKALETPPPEWLDQMADSSEAAVEWWESKPVAYQRNVLRELFRVVVHPHPDVKWRWLPDPSLVEISWRMTGA